MIVVNDRRTLYPEILERSGLALEQQYQRHVNRRTGRRAGEYFESVLVARGVGQCSVGSSCCRDPLLVTGLVRDSQGEHRDSEPTARTEHEFEGEQYQEEWARADHDERPSAA